VVDYAVSLTKKWMKRMSKSKKSLPKYKSGLINTITKNYLKHNYRVIEPETLLDVFTKFELIKIEDEFIVVLTEKVFEMEKNVLFKSPLLTMFNMIQREVIHNAFLWINRLKKE